MSHLVQIRRYAYRGEVLIGIILIVLGGMTVAGWLLRVTAMVEIIRGLVPMVFNTGLCFLLAGIGLLLDPDAQRSRSIKAGIGAYLVTLCSLTLLEHILGQGLGIDMVFVHAWYDDGNTKPGLMAPNTAAGFVLIGMIYLFSHRVKTKTVAVGIVILTFCVHAVGLTGLVGYLLAPDLLFGWARSARMAVHTATGMILSAIGLWLWWSRSQWYEGEQFFAEDSKIRFLSAGILIIVTMTVGLTGFVLLQGGFQTALGNRLEAVIYNRRPWFKAIATETANHAFAAVRLAACIKQPKRYWLIQEPAVTPCNLMRWHADWSMKDIVGW